MNIYTIVDEGCESRRDGKFVHGYPLLTIREHKRRTHFSKRIIFLSCLFSIYKIKTKPTPGKPPCLRPTTEAIAIKKIRL